MRHATPISFASASLIALALLAGTALSPSKALANPTITNLGVLPGETTSQAFAVNSNGTAVGGQSGRSLFRWSENGLANIGSLPGANFQQCLAINADGSVLAGYGGEFGSFNSTRAFRWTAANGMENLGGLPGAGYSVAQGLSADGATVVGYADTSDGETHAARWDGSSISDLGTLPGGTFSQAYGISANATTIVGSSDDINGNFAAVRWTSGGAQSLGALTGFESSEAFATSANGSVIVGYSGMFDGSSSRAFRWTESGGMENLGTLGNAPTSIGNSVSADGSIVTGSSGDTIFGYRAFLWTSQLGMVDLNTYLPTLGVNLNHWLLESAAISADGTALAGTGFFNGQRRAYVVNNIPNPGVMGILAIGGLLTTRRRRGVLPTAD